ncbi:hypothetical protein [Natrinema salaciae]|uniref:Uncharacterized protein n=1 Tax=Natrinema salaciae TaxID=1186196 RepID=A0A1H9Q294_9EURY|nr:hypothetical protein [Natrinema salaciae]SER53993.1 hypothetical protein SAMN04489841_4051 [Natrinema salaciae]
MEQNIRRPVNAVTSTVASIQRVGRLILPLAIAAAITGGGVLVFFAAVTAVVL